jgi:hypothetical protein
MLSDDAVILDDAEADSLFVEHRPKRMADFVRHEVRERHGARERDKVTASFWKELRALPPEEQRAILSRGTAIAIGDWTHREEDS